MFANLTLKSQLLAAFGVVLLALMGLTTYQITAADHAGDSLEGLFNDTYVPSVVAGGVRADLGSGNIQTRRLGEQTDEVTRATATDKLRDDIADIREALPLLRDGAASAEGRAQVDAVERAVSSLDATWTAVAGASGEAQIQLATAAAADPAYRDAYQAADDAVANLLDVEAANAEAFYADATSERDTARTVSIVVSGLVVWGGFALAWFVARRVSGQVGRSADSVSSRADGLSTVSAELSTSAEHTAEQATTAAAAAEQVSSSVQTVAAAVEEMGAAVNEISHNTTRASEIAGRAVEVAQRTGATVTKLSDSTGEISAVMDVITSIAEQTNLLALNATIEAARAGEAGKGFAVVASEVQDLARETAKATEQIAVSIAGIQTDSTEAIGAIGEIGEIINQINDIQSTIATAVEEQAASNNEISRSVSEAAEGTRAIAENIAMVATAADSTTQAAATTNRTAGELTGVAGVLQAIVDRTRHADHGAEEWQDRDDDRRFDHDPVVPQSEEDLSRRSRAELARTLAQYGADSER